MRRWGMKVVMSGALIALLLSGCGSTAEDMNAESQAVSSNMASTSTAEAVDQAQVAEGEGATPSESPLEKKSTVDPKTVGVGKTVGSGQQSSGIQPEATEAGLNKKLIYQANVVMEVKDYAKAQSEIRNLVALTGGYIIQFSENQSQEERGGSFVLKVPSNGFSSFLDRLEGLKPESIQRSIEGQDVSEEYVDLNSRLKVKQAMEAKYLKFVEEATKTSQLVEFVRELERIQTEIEQIKGRMRYIDSNVAYSTIEIRVYQPKSSIVSSDKEDTPLLGRAKDALNGTIDVLSALAQWLVVIVAGALPLIAIAAIVGILLWVRHKKSGRNKKVVVPDMPETTDKEE
ncbi:DUF4349 domain-containing protein [Paenibacillus puldeungensis]|uniref:DUF4349 domain-containing protein n=1 Tax=Paenibacillus puldeungensis TaxID=696536 RepID=A0ABW3S0W4_9BACL